MTKNAKRILMLMGGGILALLIILALFGNTYARYSSVGETDAVMSVALWDVEAVSCKIGGNTSVSPKAEKGNNVRDHSSVWEKAFEVYNGSAVSGVIYPEGSCETFSWKDGFSWDEGLSSLGSNAYGQKLMARFDIDETGEKTGEDIFREIVEEYGVLRIQTGLELTEAGEKELVGDPAYGDDDVLIACVESTSLPFLYEVGMNTVRPGEDLNVYARVLWWSIYGSEWEDGFYKPSDFGFVTEGDEDDWEAFSDAVDTILCMYADEISFVVSLNAVQDSTLPA